MGKALILRVLLGAIIIKYSAVATNRRQHHNATSDPNEMTWFLKNNNILDSKLANLESSDVGSEEGYKETVIPVESINGTKLFTGIAYRLNHEYFGKAPVVISLTYEGLEVRYNSYSPWRKLPYRIVAERRQSEWKKYNQGGELESSALFMFERGRSNQKETFALINLLATRHYPDSNIGVWVFWHWHTNPTTRYPHTQYCRDAMKAGCAYIMNNGYATWELVENNYGNIYNFKQPGHDLFLGFEDSETTPYMGLFKDENQGRFQLEMAGSQLSAEIIQFNIEPGKFKNLQNVSLIETHDIINNSSDTLTHTFVASRAVSNTFSFEFSKTLETFTTITVKTGITLFEVIKLGVERTLGHTVSVSQNQQWTTTTSHIYSVNKTVTIPPFRRVTVDGTIEMANNVKRPFVAHMLVKMSVIRLTSFSREIVLEPFPRPRLREHLQRQVKGKYIRETVDGIIFETTGTVQGSFAISSKLDVKEFPV